MTDWQPIETAPKDGREILTTFWAYDHGYWITQIAEAHADGFEMETCGLSRNIAPFTHWMPLPEPPQ